METYMREGEPRTPEPEILEAVIARAQPQILALFQRHWVSPEEADQLFDEVLPMLLLQWHRLEDPATWLVRTVDRAIQKRLLPVVLDGDDAT